MIFEFTRLGSYVKICAVDEETGLEAVVTCPANISQSEMEQHAINRMKYLKEKNKK
ncbi:MAG: hypothetical protein SFT90_00035 [Rickettsiales bacterium]|nr:hypothetical protein [Rickettsiales bacterium]